MRATRGVVTQRFEYCFVQPPGSAYPAILEAHDIRPPEPVRIEGAGGPIEAVPIVQEHGEISSLGFRFGNVAYSPDIGGVPETSLPLLQGLDLWIVDALRPMPHAEPFQPEAGAAVDRAGRRQARHPHAHDDGARLRGAAARAAARTSSRPTTAWWWRPIEKRRGPDHPGGVRRCVGTTARTHRSPRCVVVSMAGGLPCLAKGRDLIGGKGRQNRQGQPAMPSIAAAIQQLRKTGKECQQRAFPSVCDVGPTCVDRTRDSWRTCPGLRDLLSKATGHLYHDNRRLY